MNPNPVMLRAIMLQDLHASEDDRITPRQREPIDVPVGARSRLTDNLGKFVSFDDSHVALGITNRSTVSKEGDLGFKAWGNWFEIPAATRFIVNDVQVIGRRYDWYHPTR